MNSIELSLDAIVLKHSNDVAHSNKVHATNVYSIEVLMFRFYICPL